MVRKRSEPPPVSPTADTTPPDETADVPAVAEPDEVLEETPQPLVGDQELAEASGPPTSPERARRAVADETRVTSVESNVRKVARPTPLEKLAAWVKRHAGGAPEP
jgi:hypothetical protein